MRFWYRWRQSGSNLPQIGSANLPTILFGSIHPLTSRLVVLAESALHRARHTVVRFELHSLTILFARLVVLCFAVRSSLFARKRSLTTALIKEEILLDRLAPSLTAAKASHPDIAVDHLMLQDSELLPVSADGKYLHISGGYNSTLLVSTDLL